MRAATNSKRVLGGRNRHAVGTDGRRGRGLLTSAKEASDNGNCKLLRVGELRLLRLLHNLRDARHGALRRRARRLADDAVLVSRRKYEAAIVQLDLVRSALVRREGGLGVEELEHGARSPAAAVALDAVAHLLQKAAWAVRGLPARPAGSLGRGRRWRTLKRSSYVSR